MINCINKTFGYIFLVTGLVGCIAFIGVIFDFDITSNQNYIFGSKSEGAASIAPIFVAIVTAAGTYLVKE